MNITRRYFSNHRLTLSETKSKTMVYDASTGKMSFSGGGPVPQLELEKVLVFKYLGIPLSVTPYGLFKSFNDQARTKAQNYLHSVLSLVRTGPDRSELAHTLWTLCALPSILYGCEIIPLTQNTIKEINRCQSLVGKFILQIPRNSTNVCSSIDAGLRPVWAAIAEKTLLYAHNIMRRDPSYWPKIAMTEQLALGNRSPYVKHLLKWKRITNSCSSTRSQIKASVQRAAIISVLDEQRASRVSSFAMNGPGVCTTHRWFQPKSWVTDSSFSKIFAEFRSCNIGMGNRGPTKDGRFSKLCPLCQAKGVLALNNEVNIDPKYIFKPTLLKVHLLIECPEMAAYRNSCRIGPFINVYRGIYPSISSIKLYALYLNDCQPEDIKDKALSLYHMKTGWMSLMNIPY